MRSLFKRESLSIETAGRGTSELTAHVRSVLTQSGLSIPVVAGRCALGTWQGVSLWEHRHAPHRRQITVTVHGQGQRE